MKKESEENDHDIDYDQVPITRKFIIIIGQNNSSNMFYILNELVFNGKSSPDEVRQIIWDWKVSVTIINQQYLTKMWCTY